MTSLAALLLFTLVPGSQETPQAEVDRLVADLGAQDPKRREQAAAELRNMGLDAVPALRKAAHSGDAERSLKARALLLDIAREERSKEGQERSSPVPRMLVVYEDWEKGIHFTLKPDGSVRLKAPEKDGSTGRQEYRTYRAASLDEFKRKYPEVAKKVDLENLIRIREIPDGDNDLREWLGIRSFDMRRPADEESEGRRFGIMVSSTDPALAAHLGLREGEGLLVRQVEPGSLAQKAGVKPFDLIAKVNDEKVGTENLEEFRKTLKRAMDSGDFTLEVIRNGKRDTLRINPSKDDKKKSD